MMGAQKLYSDTYRHQHLSPFAYYVIMTLLGLGEFPLNSIVFDLFGEAKLLTYLMSAILAIILPLCAHFTGVLIKREPFRHGLTHTDSILLILAIIFPVGTIAAIAYLREKFFEATGVQEFMGIEINPLIITLIFMGINLLIFFGACLASYFFHDPEVQQARKELKQAEENSREDEKELAKLSALEITTHRRYQEIRQRRENEFEEKQHQANEIRDIVERLIQSYRKNNLRKRKDNQLPQSFQTLPEIQVPDALLNISWECEEIAAPSAQDTAPQQTASDQMVESPQTTTDGKTTADDQNKKSSV